MTASDINTYAVWSGIDSSTVEGFTNCATVLVLPLKLLAPAYRAVMRWLPIVSEEIRNVAWPPDKLFVPRHVASALHMTGPMGVASTALTVAVNWMSWPGSDGFCDEVKLMAVAALSMVSRPLTWVIV